MRKPLSIVMIALVMLSASVSSSAGRKNAPPAEPTFVEQILQAIMGRYDTWLMPEVKGTL